MPNVSSFGAQTDNAVVSGTVTDRQMIIPDVTPQGLMSVGPRVTPNFVLPREWNDKTTYHFFDAVRDGKGGAYVATKPVVPAGTPLTDEGYWFLWADPDTRFDDLNEIVKTFNQRITQNTDNIATKAPISHASTETTYGVGSSTNYGHVKLYNAVGTQSDGAITPNAVQSALVNIQTSIDLLTIGDSYGATPVLNRSWANQLSTLLPNCTLHNYCVSGAGWNVGGKKFENQLQQAAVDKIKPNLIVICGGRNDIITEEQARAAVDNCFSIINTNWPDAKVVVAPYLYDSTPLSNNDKLECSYVCNELANFKAIVLNHAWTWLKGRTDCFPSDDIHPNEKGAKIIANFLYQGVEGSYNGRFELATVDFAGAPATLAMTGGIITLQIGGDIASYQPCIVPSWARPSTNTAFICYTNSGTAIKIGFIDASGQLSIFNGSGSLGGVGASFSYSA